MKLGYNEHHVTAKTQEQKFATKSIVYCTNQPDGINSDYVQQALVDMI